LHEEDLAEGFGTVYLPNALARKYPNAPREFGWQYIFASKNRSIDSRNSSNLREHHRHHVAETFLQRAVKLAVREAGIVGADR
jgi:hypothetical protein